MSDQITVEAIERIIFGMTPSQKEWICSGKGASTVQAWSDRQGLSKLVPGGSGKYKRILTFAGRAVKDQLLSKGLEQFLCLYQLDGQEIGLTIQADSFDDAKARVAAIRDSLTLSGQIVKEVRHDD